MVGRREQARRQRLEREVCAELHALAGQGSDREWQRTDQDGNVMRGDQRDHRRQQRILFGVSTPVLQRALPP